MDRLVAAALVADRPGRAGIVGAGGQGVVATLAVGVADRVDRREVEHVEAELGQPRKLGFHAAQAAPGSREELVPGAELGQRAVDLDRKRRVDADRAVPGLDALEGGEQLRAERHVVLGRLGHVLVGQRGDGVLDQRLIRLGLGFACRGGEELDAFRELAGELMLLRGDLALELVAPGAEHVGPGLDRVFPRSLLVDVEAALPAHAAEVGVDAHHLGLAPVAGLRRLVADDRAQDVVAVAEDVGLDFDRVPDDALGGIPAVVDRRRRVLDHDPLGAAAWFRAARLGRGRFNLGAHARLGGCCGPAVDGVLTSRKISFLAMGKPFRVIPA